MATALLLLVIGTLSGQSDRFGLPACDAPGQHMVIRTAFTVCLSDGHNAPVWAAYELTPAMLKAVSGRRLAFRSDSELAASNADYRGSGYHRSHLVPASDLAANAEAFRESYLLSNAVPQLPELNLSAWRRIENDIRKLAADSDAVYVITGALFDCAEVQRIGPHQVAVPCATYKAVLATRGADKTAYAVVLANEPAATRQVVSVRAVERRAGLDFFSSLGGEQDALETRVLALR